jgi:hypothetical protein
VDGDPPVQAEVDVPFELNDCERVWAAIFCGAPGTLSRFPANDACGGVIGGCCDGDGSPSDVAVPTTVETDDQDG